MSAHNVIDDLTEAKNAQGYLFLYTAGVPTASIAGYSRGCLAVDTTNGKLYINTNTSLSATWTLVGSQT